MTDTDLVRPEHETARLAADAVVFARDPDTAVLLVLLVQRKWEPGIGLWGLPGGHLDPGEEDQAAAARECVEETGVHAGNLRYVGSYRSPGRDARGRVASWTWTQLLETPVNPVASDDAADARWWPVDDVLADAELWAFADHTAMVRDARAVIEHSKAREPAQQVAVTVFCSIPADQHALAAPVALRQALGGTRKVALPITVHATFASESVPVTVTAIEETGSAARKGHLEITPTASA